jgi:hypothetical protein
MNISPQKKSLIFLCIFFTIIVCVFVFEAFKNNYIDGFGKFYENFVLHYLVQLKGTNTDLVNKDGINIIKKPKSIMNGITQFNTMESLVCYYPGDNSFPAFDFYFKDDKKLVCVSVSVTKDIKDCSNGAFCSFLSKINYPTPDKSTEYFKDIYIIYIRGFGSSEWKLTFKSYKERSGADSHYGYG